MKLGRQTSSQLGWRNSRHKSWTGQGVSQGTSVPLQGHVPDSPEQELVSCGSLSWFGVCPEVYLGLMPRGNFNSQGCWALELPAASCHCGLAPLEVLEPRLASKLGPGRPAGPPPQGEADSRPPTHP